MGQAHRQILGVIGICHGDATTDLSADFHAFLQRARQLSGTRVTRCFVFSPREEHFLQQQSLAVFPELVLFPPDRRLDEHTTSSQFHTGVVVFNMCTILIQFLEATANRALRSPDRWCGAVRRLPASPLLTAPPPAAASWR